MAGERKTVAGGCRQRKTGSALPMRVFVSSAGVRPFYWSWASELVSEPGIGPPLLNVCSPHSTLPVPAQRPLRSSLVEEVGAVHGAQPMLV